MSYLTQMYKNGFVELSVLLLPAAGLFILMRSPSLLLPMLFLLVVTFIPSLLYVMLLAIVLMSLLSYLRRFLDVMYEKRLPEYVVFRNSKLNEDISIDSTATSSTFYDSDHDYDNSHNRNNNTSITDNDDRTVVGRRGRGNNNSIGKRVVSFDTSRPLLYFDPLDYGFIAEDVEMGAMKSKSSIKCRSRSLVHFNDRERGVDIESLRPRSSVSVAESKRVHFKTSTLMSFADLENDEDECDNNTLVNNERDSNARTGFYSNRNNKGDDDYNYDYDDDDEDEDNDANEDEDEDDDDDDDDDDDAKWGQERAFSLFDGHTTRTAVPRISLMTTTANHKRNDRSKPSKGFRNNSTDKKKVVSFDRKRSRVYDDRFDRQDRYFLSYKKNEYRSFERDIRLNLYKLLKSQKNGRHPWNLDPNKFCTRGLEKQIAEEGAIRLSFPACKTLLVKRSYWACSAHEKILKRIKEMQKEYNEGSVRSSRNRMSSLFQANALRGFHHDEIDLAEEIRSMSLSLSKEDRILARKRALRDEEQAKEIKLGEQLSNTLHHEATLISESLSFRSSILFSLVESLSLRDSIFFAFRDSMHFLKESVGGSKKVGITQDDVRSSGRRETQKPRRSHLDEFRLSF